MNDIGVALALSTVAVAYNNVINYWRPFHSWAYVPVNVAFAGVLVAVAIASGVSAREFGFDAELGDLWLPGGLVAVFALGAFALASSRHGHRIADVWVEGMRGSRLAFYTLVRIPIGTAAVEEVVFRGVLFASWRDAGLSDVGAAVVASAAFGLWHISPTIIGVRMNDKAASNKRLVWPVAGAVVATTAAGVALTWLRVWSESLVGPILVHAGVNSVGALAAVRALRIRSS